MSVYDIIGFTKTVIYGDYSRELFWLKIFSGAVSAVFVCIVAYAVYQTQKFFGLLRANFGLQGAASPAAVSSGVPSQKNIAAWESMKARAASDNENERKLAIIAADSLIDKILESAGYAGENLGERLKQIESSDLDSLNDIWEAHKVRNRIAHEANIILSRDETIRAMNKYEKLLKELNYL